MEENNLPTQTPIVTEPKPVRSWLRLVLFLVLGLFLVGGLVVAALEIGVPTKPRGRACTEEAKICPDGSAVGRGGPNCEFAPCPTQNVQDETANWKTYTNTKDNYSIRYPQNWFDRKGYEASGIDSEHYFSNEDTTYESLSSEGVYIFIKKYYDKTTQDNPYFYFNQDKNYPGAELITINEQPAVKTKIKIPNLSGKGDTEKYFNQVSIVYNNKIYYKITLESWINQAVKNNESTFDQILSTFRFLDQSQADETASWKTYFNYSAGYQIKYPQSWFVRGDTGSMRKNFLSITNYDKVPDGGTIAKGAFKVEIYVDEKLKSIPLDDLIRQEIMPPTEIKSKTQVMIDDLNGIRVESEGELGASTIVYLENKEGTVVYRIVDALNYPNNKSTFNLMLSTFKFLDQSQTDETANWRTFTDKDFSISFRYPNTWTIGGVRKDQSDSKNGDVVFTTEGKYEVAFNAYSNPSDLTYAEFMKKSSPSLSARYNNVVFESITTVNNVLFQRINIPKEEQGNIIFQHQKMLYVITAGSTVFGPLPENDPLNNTLIKILSTFKFLD